jgi:hypothetical protein
MEAETSEQDLRSGANGSSRLPQRRRGQTYSSSASAKPAASRPVTAKRTADAGARFRAFRQAARGQAAASSPDGTDDGNDR